MSDYNVSVIVDPAYAGQVSAEELRAQASRVLTSEAAEPDSELGVVITNAQTVQDLNRRFRDNNQPTDVLSFAHGDGDDFGTPPGANPQLGEVVISFPTALEQAEAAGRAVMPELLHLLTHGILHVMGYDHENQDDEREMHAKEEALLEGWRH